MNAHREISKNPERRCFVIFEVTGNALPTKLDSRFKYSRFKALPVTSFLQSIGSMDFTSPFSSNSRLFEAIPG